MESFVRNHWYDKVDPDKVPISHHYSFTKLKRDVHVQPQSAAPERRQYGLPSPTALVIQKVFRGYLVRKSVTKITGIKREVDEISDKVSKKETVNFLRNNAKERLRVVETLMRLLLKLDSVKGVDSGVRDLRKMMIKKAIALQEKVEALEAPAASHQTPVSERKSSCCCNISESKKNNEEILQKMVVEYQRMVGIVTELLHRDEKKTQLLVSLSQRVEMLEKAPVDEIVGRKRMRRSPICGKRFV